ncbi:hypothetical protein ABTZ03_18405 [Kitasatospora sp. NPDC096077]|uniref:hypothetical protein n=1 Tax=Kitasatospora sp. NPDC096077 TaxID=3155544 RepID=UPI003326B28C
MCTASAGRWVFRSGRSVHLRGTWGATAVDWSNTFNNPSTLAKYTGDVFGF